MQTTLLNLANAAAQMDIMYRLEIALAGQTDNFIAEAIKGSIHKKLPATQIIKEVKMMIEDNRPSMVGVLTEGLVKRLEAFEFADKNIIA